MEAPIKCNSIAQIRGGWGVPSDMEIGTEPLLGLEDFL